MRAIKLVLVTSLLVTIFALSNSLPALSSTGKVQIKDLTELTQDPFLYISGDFNKRLLTTGEQLDYLREFRKLYFSPWDQTSPRHSMDVHKWIFRHFGSGKGFGENLNGRDEEWLENLRNNADLESFGTLNRKAVSVRRTDLRLLPTERPFFYDSSLPGEGYPFDYIQNSGVHPGEPLFISHISKNGAWAWSETSYAAGWVKIQDTAFVDEELIKRWKSLPLGTAVRDDLPVKDEKGIFQFSADTGTILPLTSRYILRNRAIIPVRDVNGNAVEKTVTLDAASFTPHPLPMTAWNAAIVCEGLMDTNYGWGGMLGNRDCSATIRDILLPFGIWMPRNSAAQARTGLAIDLSEMDRAGKTTAILREGKPFATLVNKPGHVMLYIGSHKGQPVVLHNAWGLKTLENGKESRHIIGKTVITTLEPGKELENLHPDNGLLIDTVGSITLLGGIK